MERRTQQERREATERALLTAAADLVVESGLRSVTLAEVGRRAGYSRGIVTHHFGSKQALVEALVTASQAGFVPGVDEFAPGRERLLVLVERYLGAVARIGSLSRAFLVLWAESVADADLGPVFRERDALFRADIAADVEAGRAAGEVRPDVDPSVVAAIVVAELRGLALQYLVAPDSIDTAAAGRALRAHWQAVLA
ncbi:TetR/AcrR family transcriptional regulator [Actinomycetospora termitidis]|uniref:TetR/AcrR family transcriptional regulator n=1 Tax=Actinomycetospora termitidis TaxID=3053470 RepID=A0ABT7M6T9_9PSEU|nr:TetR/AcrR family transcriptional regulator [Actinomycetospora sp. Odt1-22]MDL5156258.1 TetR/AcrR family transcriptional regulator [Actinomycetospora sp. Odt1-22]